MKRYMKLIGILTCLCLLFAGCSAGQTPPPTEDQPSTDQPSTDAPADTPSEDAPATEVDWDDTLTMIRQGMVGTPQMIAVAHLGYYGGVADAPLQNWMKENCPIQLDNHPFLTSFDEDTVIGGEGDLYCLVVLDENADISLNRLNENGEAVEILYKGDGKQAILFTANGAAIVPDTSVVVVDSEGNSCEYRPMQEGGTLQPNEAVMDFTCYEDAQG